MPYFSSFFHCIVFSVTVKKTHKNGESLNIRFKSSPTFLFFPDIRHRLQQKFFLPEDQPCTCEQNRVTQDPVRENQIADDTCSNQKNGARQKKSWIHQIFLDSFVHQNPFAHNIMANRIQHIACQRRVTGRNIAEQADKNKVQHHIRSSRRHGCSHQKLCFFIIKLRHRENIINKDKEHTRCHRRNDVHRLAVLR